MRPRAIRSRRGDPTRVAPVGSVGFRSSLVGIGAGWGTARGSLLAEVRGRSRQETERKGPGNGDPRPRLEAGTAEPSTGAGAARRAQGPLCRRPGHRVGEQKREETVPREGMVEETFLGTKLSPAVDDFPSSLPGTVRRGGENRNRAAVLGAVERTRTLEQPLSATGLGTGVRSRARVVGPVTDSGGAPRPRLGPAPTAPRAPAVSARYGFATSPADTDEEHGLPDRAEHI